jgi:hypothetical protein
MIAIEGRCLKTAKKTGHPPRWQTDSKGMHPKIESVVWTTLKNYKLR